MKTFFTIIHPDGRTEGGSADLPAEPNYGQLHVLLSPIFFAQRGRSADFEHVTVLGTDGKRTDMFVDETGALDDLPVNEEATRHYHRASITHRGAIHREGIMPGEAAIHGIAVLFARKVWF